MKYTRLSLRIVMVFVFVFAAAFLFFLAPRQAIGAGTLTYGILVPDADTRSCSATGNTTFSCSYEGVGTYRIYWEYPYLRTPICTVSASADSIVPDTGSPVCLPHFAGCAPPKFKGDQKMCAVTIECSGQSVTYDEQTNKYLVNPLPLDVTLTVICAQ